MRTSLLSRLAIFKAVSLYRLVKFAVFVKVPKMTELYIWAALYNFSIMPFQIRGIEGAHSKAMAGSLGRSVVR